MKWEIVVPLISNDGKIKVDVAERLAEVSSLYADYATAVVFGGMLLDLARCQAAKKLRCKHDGPHVAFSSVGERFHYIRNPSGSQVADLLVNEEPEVIIAFFNAVGYSKEYVLLTAIVATHFKYVVGGPGSRICVADSEPYYKAYSWF